jgi:hypothetical protein
MLVAILQLVSMPLRKMRVLFVWDYWSFAM